jgi:hypothetical protein
MNGVGTGTRIRGRSGMKGMRGIRGVRGTVRRTERKIRRRRGRMGQRTGIIVGAAVGNAGKIRRMIFLRCTSARCSDPSR